MTTMRVTVTIHAAWLARPDDLRRALDMLAELEGPPADTGTADHRAAGPRQGQEEPPDPEERPRGRRTRYPADDDRRQARRDDDDPEDDPPIDGRQLLGWAAKQVPDAKGRVIALGKERGFPPRILDWTPQQVQAAYRSARARAER
jgi:hypothetical protein